MKKAVLGKMERFYLKTPAAGQPFDHGVFELVEEQIKPFDPMDPAHFSIAQTQFPAEWLAEEPDLQKSLMLERSMLMLQYVESGIVKQADSPWFDPAKREAIKQGIAIAS